MNLYQEVCFFGLLLRDMTSRLYNLLRGLKKTGPETLRVISKLAYVVACHIYLVLYVLFDAHS